MLEYIPEQRATAAQMLQHPWLTGKLASVGLQDRDRHRAPSSPRLVKRSRCIPPFHLSPGNSRLDVSAQQNSAVQAISNRLYEIKCVLLRSSIREAWQQWSCAMLLLQT